MNGPEIQALLNRAVAEGDVAGVAAAVIGPEGPRFMGTAGTTEAGGSAPVTENSVFWIASMTKPVASIAAMQLVEQGKLSLDAPIGELLPALADAADPRRRAAAPGAGQNHAAASAHPHLRLRLFLHPRGIRRLYRGQQHPALGYARRAQHAAAVRARRTLGIRHQHRLGGSGGGSGLRPQAGCLFPEAYFRAARHERHHLPAERGAAQRGACPCTSAKPMDGSPRARWRQ